MATIYISQAGHASADGTKAKPYSIAWFESNEADGNTYYFLGTITERVSISVSGSSDTSRIIVRGDDPDYPGVIDGGFGAVDLLGLTLNNCNYISVIGLEVRNFKRAGIYRGETGDAGTDSSYIVIKDCYVHDIYGDGTGDENGIQIWGVGTLVEDTRVENVGTDGVWLKGASSVVRRVTILHGDPNPTATGNHDCIQFGGASPNSIVEDCYLDGSAMTASKPIQAVVCLGNGIIVRRNRCIGSGIHVSSGGFISVQDGTTDTIVEGNYITDAMGITYNGSATGIARGNILVGIGTTARSGILSSTGIVATYNNTITGYNGTGFSGIETAAAGCVSKNNLVTGCAIGLSVVDGGHTYNCAYGNGTNFSNALGTGDITTNPLLQSDYSLGAGSPARNAGVWIAGVRAYDDLPLPLSPDIGAVQDRTAAGRRFGAGGGTL